MDVAGVTDSVENFNPQSPSSGQFLPPVVEGDGGAIASPVTGDGLECLREEVRRLARDVVAIDRRDAAQHGALKGEIAHLVRRLVRLEALPRSRPVR
jgi:hypothetical protein